MKIIDRIANEIETLPQTLNFESVLPLYIAVTLTDLILACAPNVSYIFACIPFLLAGLYVLGALALFHMGDDRLHFIWYNVNNRDRQSRVRSPL